MANPRARKFAELRNEGMTNAQIANQFGISRERVRQVLKKIGYHGKPDFQNRQSTPEQKEDRLKRKRKFIHDWQKRNPEKKTAYHRKYVARRMEVDENFKMRIVLASRIRVALKKSCGTKSARTMQLVGCSVTDLKKHLEKQFQPGMSWDNWGNDGWHIDHIRPCSSFDLNDPAEQVKCFHYTNMQPLWATDNLKKGSTWESQ